ncbi:hypothetical protein FGIG_02313 [Fasciola gigantica]|uniref:Uncharacterized protein n=1 Tax=Fasciola gigantica TaxID=46835 RepID=A0A504Z5J9_FASGI|nr:hypothetical protein FGIG_02313 [Fasciola gigantica]
MLNLSMSRPYDHRSGVSVTRLVLLLMPLMLILIQILDCGSAAVRPQEDTPVIVRFWLRLYTYPYKLKANRDWCNPFSPNEPCSPAFRLCFLHSGTSQDTCQANVEFGGQRTVFANRNIIRFRTILSSTLYNPISFLLPKWKSYPSINLTVTNDDFDTEKNLLGRTTLHMDKLDRPAATKWRAKWNKAILRMAGDKMKIILSYQAYYAWPSRWDKVIRVHDLTVPVGTTPIVPEEEPLQKRTIPQFRSKVPVTKMDTHLENQSITPTEVDSRKVATKLSSSPDYENQKQVREYIVSNKLVTEEETNPPKPRTTKTTTTKSTSSRSTKRTTAVRLTTGAIATAESATTTTTTATTKRTTTETTSTVTTARTTITTNAPHISGGVIAAIVIALSVALMLLTVIPLLCYKYRDRLFSGYRPLERS